MDWTRLRGNMYRCLRAGILWPKPATYLFVLQANVGKHTELEATLNQRTRRSDKSVSKSIPPGLLTLTLTTQQSHLQNKNQIHLALLLP